MVSGTHHDSDGQASRISARNDRLEHPRWSARFPGRFHCRPRPRSASVSRFACRRMQCWNHRRFSRLLSVRVSPAGRLQEVSGGLAHVICGVVRQTTLSAPRVPFFTVRATSPLRAYPALNLRRLARPRAAGPSGSGKGLAGRPGTPRAPRCSRPRGEDVRCRSAGHPARLPPPRHRPAPTTLCCAPPGGRRPPPEPARHPRRCRRPGPATRVCCRAARPRHPGHPPVRPPGRHPDRGRQAARTRGGCRWRSGWWCLGQCGAWLRPGPCSFLLRRVCGVSPRAACGAGGGVPDSFCIRHWTSRHLLHVGPAAGGRVAGVACGGVAGAAHSGGGGFGCSAGSAVALCRRPSPHPSGAARRAAVVPAVAPSAVG